jgi:hypothetical protein
MPAHQRAMVEANHQMLADAVLAVDVAHGDAVEPSSVTIDGVEVGFALRKA